MHAFILALLGVLLPPAAVLIEKGCGCDFLINLVLTLVLFWAGGIIHAFYLFGVEICVNILCLFLAPVGVLLEFGCSVQFAICLILFILGVFPGVIYAYYAVLLKKGH